MRRYQRLSCESATAAASCDILAQAKLDILWGPLRHGPGHNVSTYHKNPAGQIVRRLFAEKDPDDENQDSDVRSRDPGIMIGLNGRKFGPPMVRVATCGGHSRRRAS